MFGRQTTFGFNGNVVLGHLSGENPCTYFHRTLLTFSEFDIFVGAAFNSMWASALLSLASLVWNTHSAHCIHCTEAWHVQNTFWAISPNKYAVITLNASHASKANPNQPSPDQKHEKCSTFSNYKWLRIIRQDDRAEAICDCIYPLVNW